MFSKQRRRCFLFYLVVFFVVLFSFVSPSLSPHYALSESELSTSEDTEQKSENNADIDTQSPESGNQLKIGENEDVFYEDMLKQNVHFSYYLLKFLPLFATTKNPEKSSNQAEHFKHSIFNSAGRKNVKDVLVSNAISLAKKFIFSSSLNLVRRGTNLLQQAHRLGSRQALSHLAWQHFLSRAQTVANLSADDALPQPVSSEASPSHTETQTTSDNLFSIHYLTRLVSTYVPFISSRSASTTETDSDTTAPVQDPLAQDPTAQDLSVVRLANSTFWRLAVEGEPVAQTAVAMMYAVGLSGVPADPARSLLYYTFGALGGSDWAQMALSYRHYYAIGVPKNCESALIFYSRVANTVVEGLSFSSGSFVVRTRLMDEGTDSSSSRSAVNDDVVQYYQFLADKGNSHAKLVLGHLYLQGGKGVEYDEAMAFQLLQEAAEAGESNAFALLGKMYLDGGELVEQDRRMAFSCFTSAAQQDSLLGVVGLGYMHMHGLSVPVNYTQAFTLLLKASEQGSVEASAYLADLYFEGKGVEKSFSLALKHWNSAAQSGNILAIKRLADMYSSGSGVLRSCSTAVQLYKTVAERGWWAELFMDAHRDYHNGRISLALLKYIVTAQLGYEVAQNNVAFILHTHDVSLMNVRLSRQEAYKMAYVYWTESAAQGSSAARVMLGDYHYYGLGTQVDYARAADEYREAHSTLKNAQAAFNLGYMYEQGQGVDRDLHLAKRFYDYAKQNSKDALVPVTLVMFRLRLYLLLEEYELLTHVDKLMTYLYTNNIVGLFSQHVASDWDIYVFTVLAIVTTAVYYFRRLN